MDSNTHISKTKEKRILSLEQVSFRYPRNKDYILEDVNLNVYAGDRIGIIGGNGCGKSTLSKLILGIFKPTKGNIQLFGQPVKWHNHTPNVGYIGDPGHNTQELGLPTWLTVEQIITITNKLHRIEGKTIDYKEMTSKLGLVTLFDRKIANLSTGERKRLMIYLTFVDVPELIILDEPFDGLDEEVVLYVKVLLNHAMSDKKLSLFFISHSQIEIDTYTNIVYRVKNKNLLPIIQHQFFGKISFPNQDQKSINGKTGEIMGQLINVLKSDQIKSGLIIDLKPTPNS